MAQVLTKGLGSGHLTAYGIGIMVGAGIYVLGVFVVVNAALIGLKRREGPPVGAFCVPVWVPWIGILGSIALTPANFLEHLA
ncbi:MAG: hypothetical protein ACRBCL_08995 [Maritimibacter sp.]